MTNEKSQRERAFYRWLAEGPKELEEQARRAIAEFLPQFEAAGFQWVEKDFDGGHSQVNAVSLERCVREGQIDFVSIIFDKHRSGRFKVICGTKKKAPPHYWVKAGDLVRHQSELDRAKWWGPMWWNLNRKKAFDNAVERVSALLPQLIAFLSKGTAGSHIYQWPIKQRR